MKILFPRGNRSPRVLEGALTKKGYDVTSPVIYKTELCNTIDEQVKKLIYSDEADCLAFTSPSSVIAFVSILGQKLANKLLDNTVISAIGPTTSQACNDAGLKVDILPNQYTVQSMARAIAHYYSRTSKRPQ